MSVTAATAMTMLATNDQEGGCVATMSFSLDLCDVPPAMREDPEFIDSIDQTASHVIDHVATLLRAHADPKRSANDGAGNFTCIMEVRVGGTIEEAMATITGMLATAGTPESLAAGAAVSVGLPFQWEVSAGDATITGVTPATLTVDARDGVARTQLVVRYTVHLNDEPEAQRQLIIESFKDSVMASRPLWRGAVYAAATE